MLGRGVRAWRRNAMGLSAFMAVLLVPVAVLADRGSPDSPPRDRSANLALALNADGILRGDGAVTGTVDIGAWTLVSNLATGEPPRFAPAGQAAATPTGPWSAVGSDGAGDGALNSTVYSIGISGTDVYVGGAFKDAAGIPEADYIAKWNGTEWSAFGSDGAGDGALKDFVDVVAISGTDVYVGGAFTNAAGIPEADHIAKWNGTWSALGSNGAGNGALNNTVHPIVFSGGDAYVGGAFTNAAGLPEADYIAKWNGSAWSAVGSAGSRDAALRGAVYALAVSSDDLYVGGAFKDAAGIPEADYIATWNGRAWSALGSDGAGDGVLNGAVHSIVFYGSDLYVGGAFKDAAGIPEADYVATWNDSAWWAVGSDGSGVGVINGRINSLLMFGGDLYVAGQFRNAAGVPQADYVAMWNGTAWSALGSDGKGNGALNVGDQFGGGCCTLRVSGGDLYVGGTFTNAAGTPEADYVARWQLVTRPPFRDSVPTPAEITLDPVIVAQSVALAVGVVLFVPFPSALFNSTLGANYADVSGWASSVRRRLGRITTWIRSMARRLFPRQLAASASVPPLDHLDHEAGTAAAGGDTESIAGVEGWTTPRALAFSLLVAALLCCFLDPTFGLDLVSVATFVGVMLGLVVTLLVFGLPSVVAYLWNGRRARSSDPGEDDDLGPRGWSPYIRALPGAFAIGGACVLISRLTDFQPGYLYGLIIGVAATNQLTDTHAARTATAATVVMLVVAGMAWFSLGWVAGLTSEDGGQDLPFIGFKTALTTVMVAGLQGALFGLLPLRFLPGEKVRTWNWRIWGGLSIVALVGFWHVLVNPASGYLADSSRTPLLTVVALLLFFGLGSVLFWAFFWLRGRRHPAAAATT